jgi:geranylgeranylglyceryl phosphate synthase family protein
VTVLARIRAAGGLAILVDPDRVSIPEACSLARRAADEGACAVLVGTSFGSSERTGRVAVALKDAALGIPVVQFPATAADLVADVDAVLLLSLISGRNPQYLIEEHVRSVPFFERNPGVEAISTAYVLIDGGRITSVEAVSQTRPLPADKPELVRAHVRAASLIGMGATYLDAGSGARAAISPVLVRAARDASEGALFVGGGITDGAGVRAARDAGADVVVVGSLFEKEGSRTMRAMALAARA